MPIPSVFPALPELGVATADRLPAASRAGSAKVAGSVGSSSSSANASDAASAPALSVQERAVNAQTRLNLLIWLLIGALILAALQVRLAKPWEPGDAVGYNLGLVGGVLMLLLLTYPLKKHVPLFRRWGTTRPWFIFHMLCGVLGPLAILFHSTFTIGSQNALVAMVSMLLVAGSGIMGRYLYVRIHDGLTDQELRLDALEGDAETRSRSLARDLHWAPDIVERLSALRKRATGPADGGMAEALRLLRTLLDAALARRACRRYLALHLDERARKRGWDAERRQLRQRQFEQLVDRYVIAVIDAARFATLKRIFGLWHILHLPFVFLLAASAAYHVLAVHMY